MLVEKVVKRQLSKDGFTKRDYVVSEKKANFEKPIGLILVSRSQFISDNSRLCCGSVRKFVSSLARDEMDSERLI